VSAAAVEPSASATAAPGVVRPGAGVRSLRATRTGVQFDPLLPFETWEALGARLGCHANATSWWLGDWLTFGRQKYGRRYKQAMAGTGLDYQTLRNYAAVSRRFEPSRRRSRLTFQHHADVCALSDADQDLWLDRALLNGWSRNELRRRLHAARTAEHVPSRVFRIEVESDRADRWARAAERADCGCTAAWMLQVLDAASGDGGP
jgi:hypothetical protein